MTDKAKALGEQPAFPCGPFGSTSTPVGIISHQIDAQTGMTLRQWLFGQALNGLCANRELDDSLAEIAMAQTKSALETLAKD